MTVHGRHSLCRHTHSSSFKFGLPTSLAFTCSRTHSRTDTTFVVWDRYIAQATHACPCGLLPLRQTCMYIANRPSVDVSCNCCVRYAYAEDLVPFYDEGQTVWHYGIMPHYQFSWSSKQTRMTQHNCSESSTTNQHTTHSTNLNSSCAAGAVTTCVLAVKQHPTRWHLRCSAASCRPGSAAAQALRLLL